MESERRIARGKPKRLPPENFLESFEDVPRVAVNLVIIDADERVLLTKRSIPPFEGSWHFPGSFLLKNEPIPDAQRRVAKDEFGLELDEDVSLALLGAFDDIDHDPRGHVIDLVYGLSVDDDSQIKPTKETSEVQFFDKNKLPKDIGFNHRDTLHKLGYKDEQ